MSCIRPRQPTRLVGYGRESFRQGEGSGVEGLADDGTLDSGRFQSRDLAQVVHRGYAAGRDHARVRPARDATQQVEVRTTQRSVLADVGDDIALRAVSVEPLQRPPQVATVTGPPAGGEPVAALADADIETDRAPVAVLPDHPGTPLRILQRRGSQVHSARTGRQRRIERLLVPNSTGQLDPHVQLPDDLCEQVT